MKTMKKLTALILAAALAAGLAGCGSGTDNDRAFADAKAKLCNYKGIPVSIEDPGVTDGDVERYLKTIIDYHNREAREDRTTIEEGDTVQAELHMFDKDGNELTDGTMNEGSITIGAGATHEELEKGLVGKETGSEYEIPITLSDPYEYNEELSGQTITAKVRPIYIRAKDTLSLETLTDEQAALLGDDVHSVAELTEKARRVLTDQAQEDVRVQAYSEICSYLLDHCSVKPFPGAELKARIEQSMEQSKTLCESYYDITFEEYLTQIGMTEDEYRKDIESTLTDTLKLEVIFTAIGDAEGIQYDESEFDAYVADVAAQGSFDGAEGLFAEYGEDYIKRAYRIEYVVDWLIGQADMSYKVPQNGAAVSGNSADAPEQ